MLAHRDGPIAPQYDALHEKKALMTGVWIATPIQADLPMGASDTR